MAKIRDAVRIPLIATATGGSTDKVASDRVQPGQMLVCQSIAFRNRSGARGTATLQIRGSNNVFSLGDQVSPAANEWYYYPYEQYVNEGENVEVQQASCSAADILDLVIIGYIEYKVEVVPNG